MLQPKLPQGEQGFTLTEMLVAMLITSMFIALTMQAVVIAAIFKARTEQYDQAITWIQEDSELVINQSSEYEKNDPYSSKCNAAVAANGLAAGFASLLNDPTGIGDTFRTDGPRTFGGKAFILTRTAVYATSYDPFKLLELTYTVTPQSGGAAIATISTEVITDAAFKCPQT